jgi:hypothetical protein
MISSIYVYGATPINRCASNSIGLIHLSIKFPKHAKSKPGIKPKNIPLEKVGKRTRYIPK